ncbi:4Fe-4S binding protein [Pseudoduganella buxea]|uniref:4Fe-4S dicluster domain-containing protein n=1 Tax=Pseudoduganella buxea TaxID=1949069 RepID=A0A6I3T966_9BURK|nr:4Fe-4S binding protein [Pseudoduganella buxea]MTV56187.1 4Fe-4S dicluster domain-containing protein [Pseudoduganella buxea]GGC02078.1 4Fe-4S ferredoxin [Pseudoduganella buxea]
MNVPFQEGADCPELHATLAAVRALENLPPTQAVDAVAYRSNGKTLVIGPAAQALPLADYLAQALFVTVLLRDETPAAFDPRAYAVLQADAIALTGWLGAFAVRWQATGEAARQDSFDLVLDLDRAPLIATHQPPNGYFAPGADPLARRAAADALLDMVGEFEKPKYFLYKERLCAHGRNTLVGCNACVDICSAGAITGAGDLVKINPYLCAGCGACGTVCPTGALSYAYPTPGQMGRRMKTALRAYREAGVPAAPPVVLFHDAGRPPAQLEAGIIPFPVHHTASTGLDLWLTALAYGAGSVAVLLAGGEAPQYGEALARQMAIGQAIMAGLGYAGPHFWLFDPANPAQPVPGQGPDQVATFDVAAAKRDTLEYALDHLQRHAPVQPETVVLPPGASFGAIAVNRDACSLCMACVGACPASALLGGDTLPQLRFVEKNCVQCGLCANTCPEDAIALVPRMSFAATRNTPVVMHGSEPFHCICCNKPFGTLQMIETMLAKLSQHAAFAGNLDRMKMCGDCRVIDMMRPQDEMKVIPLRRG